MRFVSPKWLPGSSVVMLHAARGAPVTYLNSCTRHTSKLPWRHGVQARLPLSIKTRHPITPPSKSSPPWRSTDGGDFDGGLVVNTSHATEATQARTYASIGQGSTCCAPAVAGLDIVACMRGCCFRGCGVTDRGRGVTASVMFAHIRSDAARYGQVDA